MDLHVAPVEIKTAVGRETAGARDESLDTGVTDL